MKRYTSLVLCDTVLPTKRLRRNNIIVSESKTACSTSNCGNFEFVPLDLRLHILSYLSITDLGIFSLVSKSARSLVEEFYSFKTYAHFPKRTLHSAACDEQKKTRCEKYKKIGILLKRVTCTYTTAARIQIIDNYLQQHVCFASESCLAPSQCCALSSFGFLIKTFTNGWLETENQKLFHSLVHSCFTSNFWRRLTSLTASTPGSSPDDELQTRLFLRKIFLDPHSENTEIVATCLIRILRSWPIVQRARILFILYGPMHRSRLMWTAMCASTAADGEQVRACFGELGWAISTLHSTKNWSDDDANAVLDELTTTPDDWLSENVACLLHTMGPQLASSMVISKAVNGRSSELAVTLTSMSLVAVKLHCSLNPILLLVEKACKATSTERHRRVLLDQLARAFQDVIIELYETDDIDNRIDDFSTLLKAQSYFVRALLGKVYEE